MGIKRKLFVTVLLAIAAMPLSAQSTVAHEIVKGNTIYSLAKEYGSTVEAINEANPNIGVRSLVIGETLMIPIPKDTLVNQDVGSQVLDQTLTQAPEYEVYLVKRKTIGRVFIEVFDQEAALIEDVKWLAQGTIYPDIIESVSVKGPSATIKSHHNVGGLPDFMKLKVVEPLKTLFKDEVRRVGASMDMSKELLGRHPFPGPGLAIRILGDITREKVEILQEVDYIFINGLKNAGLYDKVWQAGSILLPVNSVGVMGDERTYEKVVALRAVESTDGMTADWVHLPYEFLAKVSNQIINKVKGVNRVVYDISSKPPATIEWE